MSPPLTRRNFLTLAWKGLLGLSGLLGLGGLRRYFSYQPEPAAPTSFDLGPAGQYPPGSRTVLPEAQAVLFHDEGGFQAYSLVCPHLGCLVEPGPEGYACPCHGSRFTLSGAVARGPAAQPLRRLKLEQTADGRLVLETGAEF